MNVRTQVREWIDKSMVANRYPIRLMQTVLDMDAIIEKNF